MSKKVEQMKHIYSPPKANEKLEKEPRDWVSDLVMLIAVAIAAGALLLYLWGTP